MAKYKKSVALARQMCYRPDGLKYYAGKVTTAILVRACADKKSISVSALIDMCVNAFFEKMTKAEREGLIMDFKQKNNANASRI